MSSEPEDYKKEYIKDLKAIKKEIEGIRNNSWGYWSRGMDLAVEAIDVAISDIRKDKRDGSLVMFSSDRMSKPASSYP